MADDLRQSRSNVTIEASWTETFFEAFNNDGERFVSLAGESTLDLEEDLERALCDAGVAPTTTNRLNRGPSLTFSQAKNSRPPLRHRLINSINIFNRSVDHPGDGDFGSTAMMKPMVRRPPLGAG